MISNCGTRTEKGSEFLDFHFKALMQSSWSYIWDSIGFIAKMKIGIILEADILATAEVVEHHSSIPQKEGLEALKEKYEEKTSSKIP